MLFHATCLITDAHVKRKIVLDGLRTLPFETQETVWGSTLVHCMIHIRF